MKFRFFLVTTLGLGLLGVACSSTDDGGGSGGAGGSGAVPATGGVAATGNVPLMGGTATGGAGPLGGDATGGVGATGAVGITGGAFPTGGATPVGGTGGGIPTGGVMPSGGVSSGGTNTGGIGAGGSLPTGGVGPDTGGALPTGGGGTDTGGADTGGVGAGGTGTGGAQPTEPTLITSGPGAYWQEGEVTVGGNSANITVNDSQEYQHWTGWGGTFNEKGWDAMKALSQADRDRAIRLLFDRNDGCGFTWGRIPIGSSDYGLSRYTLAETNIDSFSIARDQQDLIPYIKAAQAVKSDIRFWATAWTPPPWMKDNNAYDRGNMKGDAATLGAYAEYLVRFVEAYEGEGIHVEAVGPQNEPGYPQDYPSCVWSSSVYTDFVANYMGPLFASRIPDREIWAATMSNPNSNTIVQSVMNNGTARGYITRIGTQWGQDQYVSQYVSSYGLPVMQTEHQCGNYPWQGGYQQTAPNDQAYAVESWGLIKTWIENGVDSYSAWNMVLDTVGRSLDDVRPWAQNALLTVNVNAGQLILTPTYYVFRHFAQYVEPGAVRVGVSGGDALAWKNPDGSIVTVMYNSGGSPAQTTLSVGGTMVQFQIPANGWATVNWQ